MIGVQLLENIIELIKVQRLVFSYFLFHRVRVILGFGAGVGVARMDGLVDALPGD